ncbi:MAG TPA: DUF421 domain-containing protein [Burkholderiaceae bacterium]|nr:DUF421 domain-containing protein [Burkholderiaceae bacterium]
MPDWDALFGIRTPLAELVVRGTVMYWTLFLLFRFVLRRDAGAVGIADLLFVVVIADAAQNAFAGEYTSITEGLALVATLAVWNMLLDWLGFRFRFFERLTDPPPRLLVRNGALVARNLRAEWITRDEVMAKLREQGIEDLSAVRWAYMESDGRISVGTIDGKTGQGSDPDAPPPLG